MDLTNATFPNTTTLRTCKTPLARLPLTMERRPGNEITYFHQMACTYAMRMSLRNKNYYTSHK